MKRLAERLWGTMSARLFIVVFGAIVVAVLAVYGLIWVFAWVGHLDDPSEVIAAQSGGGPYVQVNGLEIPDQDSPFELQEGPGQGLPRDETRVSLSRVAGSIPGDAYASLLPVVAPGRLVSAGTVGEGRIPAPRASRWQPSADPTVHLPADAVRLAAQQGWASGSFEYVYPRLEGEGISVQAEYAAWKDPDGAVRYVFVAAPPPADPAGSAAGSLIGYDPRVFALAAALAVVLISFAAAFLTSRGIVRPIRRAVDAAERLAAGRDLTPLPVEGPRDLASLSRSFNELAARVTRAQEAESVFLLSVSHELKTPLTAVRGYAEALEDGALTADEAGPVIGAEAGRLERLVADLLDLARFRRSEFSVDCEPFDLARTAQAVRGRYAGAAAEYGVDLIVESTPAAPALGDGDRVLQIVSNLVENAMRCTQRGGRVTVRVAPGLVTVADSGIGLTSEDLLRVFERFYLYRRFGADRPVGTGLGLAIVRELTVAMGGTVDVGSRLGEGTTFVVRLPEVGEQRAWDGGPLN